MITPERPEGEKTGLNDVLRKLDIRKGDQYIFISRNNCMYFFMHKEVGYSGE